MEGQWELGQGEEMPGGWNTPQVSRWERMFIESTCSMMLNRHHTLPVLQRNTEQVKGLEKSPLAVPDSPPGPNSPIGQGHWGLVWPHDRDGDSAPSWREFRPCVPVGLSLVKT